MFILPKIMLLCISTTLSLSGFLPGNICGTFQRYPGDKYDDGDAKVYSTLNTLIGFVLTTHFIFMKPVYILVQRVSFLLYLMNEKRRLMN